jgi:hypothetical protein
MDSFPTTSKVKIEALDVWQPQQPKMRTRPSFDKRAFLTGLESVTIGVATQKSLERHGKTSPVGHLSQLIRMEKFHYSRCDVIFFIVFV